MSIEIMDVVMLLRALPDFGLNVGSEMTVIDVGDDGIVSACALTNKGYLTLALKPDDVRVIGHVEDDDE